MKDRLIRIGKALLLAPFFAVSIAACQGERPVLAAEPAPEPVAAAPAIPVRAAP